MTRNEAFTILECQPNATDDEIKKQYKKMMFKHHPDRNINNRHEAEEHTKQIGLAYQTLTKPNNNQDIHMNADIFNQFNRMREDFMNMHNQQTNYHQSFINTIKSPHPAQSIRIEANVPINHLLYSKSEIFTIEVNQAHNCKKCGGIKFILDDPTICPICNGKGMRTISQGFFIQSSTCNHCRGIGTIYRACNECSDDGFIYQKKSIDFPMFNDNGIIDHHILKDMGYPSKNMTPEQKGTLEILIKFTPNDVFTIENKDGVLYLSNVNPVLINISDIIRGKQIKIPIIGKTKKVYYRNIKLPKNAVFGIDINPSTLDFNFLVNDIGFKIGNKNFPYLVKTRVNYLLK